MAHADDLTMWWCAVTCDELLTSNEWSCACGGGAAGVKNTPLQCLTAPSLAMNALQPLTHNLILPASLLPPCLHTGSTPGQVPAQQSPHSRGHPARQQGGAGSGAGKHGLGTILEGPGSISPKTSSVSIVSRSHRRRTYPSTPDCDDVSHGQHLSTSRRVTTTPSSLFGLAAAAEALAAASLSPGAGAGEGGSGSGGGSGRGDNTPCNTLFIGNLSDGVDEGELHELFGKQSGFKQMKLVRGSKQVGGGMSGWVRGWVGGWGGGRYEGSGLGVCSSW